MKKRILLTGSTGFVGRQVLAHIAKEDVQITLVVRGNKQEVTKKYPGVDNVIITPDLFLETDRWWSRILQDIDTVIHIAWYTVPEKYLYSFKNIDCLQGTLSMAKGAAQAGVKRFIGIGTCFEYEFSNNVLTIETPLKPLTLYASAKAAAYLALEHYLASQGIAFAWCRLFYLYGEAEDSRRLVPYLRAKLSAGEMAEMTSGKQIRDYMDVSEVGRLISEITFSTAKGPINICSGIPITVKKLAENIADEYGRRDLLNFGARPDNLIDPPYVVGLRK